MRIAVVGTGAMGSVYAGLLADAGHEVWAIDVDAGQIEAIRSGGLRVEGASGDRVVRLSATTDPAEAPPAELVVIATKAMYAQDAARSALPLIGPESAVLTIQNGLGAADEVAEIVDEDRLLVGIAGGFGAELVVPGHVHHHGMELVRIGERHGGVTERTERVADAWRQAGFTVETCADIDRLIWEKLICNACFAGICALLELRIGDVLDSPHAWPVALRCAQEALDVARASGVAVAVDDCERYVRDYGRPISAARPSMLIDLLAGRRCEVEWINGAVPRRGAAVGVDAPANRLVTALVLARQAKFLL